MFDLFKKKYKKYLYMVIDENVPNEKEPHIVLQTNEELQDYIFTVIDPKSIYKDNYNLSEYNPDKGYFEEISKRVEYYEDSYKVLKKMYLLGESRLYYIGLLIEQIIENKKDFDLNYLGKFYNLGLLKNTYQPIHITLNNYDKVLSSNLYNIFKDLVNVVESGRQKDISNGLKEIERILTNLSEIINYTMVYYICQLGKNNKYTYYVEPYEDNRYAC